MSVNLIGNSGGASNIQQGGKESPSSIERRIKQLEEQLKQVKTNHKLSPDEREKRIENLENQIERLKEKADGGEVSEEVTDAVQADRIQKEQEADLSEQYSGDKQRYDTFEPQPESQSAGLYEVGRDENGNPVVNFDEFRKDTI